MGITSGTACHLHLCRRKRSVCIGFRAQGVCVCVWSACPDLQAPVATQGAMREPCQHRGGGWEFVKTHFGLGCRCPACFVMFIFPRRIRCAGAFNRSRRALACRIHHVLIAIAGDRPAVSAKKQSIQLRCLLSTLVHV